MTFYTYMTRKHKNDDTPAGDLARDMIRDREKFPRNSSHKLEGWRKLIRSYLYDNNGCIKTFDECWEEYAKCEKKRLNRNS